MQKLKNKISKTPSSPGVYLMKNANGEIVYVGKATSLKERLRSYFQNDLPAKTRKQMSEVADIEVIKTDSGIEALFLESQLIKKHSPKYNVKEKDDKSRIYVYISRDDFPSIETVRETDLGKIKEKRPTLYGPFTSSKSVADALDLIRKIIPFRTCRKFPNKQCLYGYLGLCEAPCEDKISKVEYKKRTRQARDFFEGKKSRIISSLKRELKEKSEKQEYEEAAILRDKIYALEHLAKMYILSKDNPPSIFKRIEGYDISNIFGEYAVGSMVVFVNGVSDKSEYRKFKIKSVRGANDTAMLKEVMSRRFSGRHGWEYPDLIIVDGGRGQVNAVVSVLTKRKIKIPVIGLAKGPDRKKDEIVTSQILPRADISIFKQVRDEAHRFARGYYEKLHRRNFSHKVR